MGQIVINPPLDAVGEAKISMQSYDAEFGQSVAAVVNAQTKSGTNDFHGDAFDYRRSGAQLARNPYNQFAPYSALSTRLTPPALYNQFGGSVGGPILKNKVILLRRLPGRPATQWSFRSRNRSDGACSQFMSVREWMRSERVSGWPRGTAGTDLQSPRGQSRHGTGAFCKQLHSQPISFFTGALPPQPDSAAEFAGYAGGHRQ